jgi:PilZ domain.
MNKKQRSDNRVEFLTKCQLDINGRTHNCLVDNISTTGAAIEMTVAGQDDIRVGETGTLNVLLLSPVTYQCRVVRISANLIGVQFID